MPTLVGMLAGSRMAKDFLNVPWFIKELMENHFRSLLLITVTFFGEDDAAGKRIVFHVYLDDGH